jgi:hypothetical protein
MLNQESVEKSAATNTPVNVIGVDSAGYPKS